MTSARTWPFWLAWVLASSAGWAVGGLVVRSGLGPDGDIIGTGYLGVAVGGIMAALFQSLVLRRRVDRTAAWVWTGVGAAALVGILIVVGGWVAGVDVGWVLGAGSYGTVAGVLQWPVLKQHSSRAPWWVAATTLGWVAGGPVGGFVGWAALGAVYGALTGGVLVWLTRQPPT